MRRDRLWLLVLTATVVLAAGLGAPARAEGKHALVVYTVLFEPRSAALGADDQAVLRLMAGLMHGKSAFDVRLLAFTDPVDEDKDDEELAKARAKAVRAFLVEQGTDEDDVDLEARGDEKVFGRDDAEGDRALRRRVEVRVRQKDAEKRAIESHLDEDEVASLLQTTVFFDFDKAEVRPEFKATLAQLGAMLKGDPDYVVRVFGHTDGIGSPQYNVALGHRRCATVAAELAAAGADPGVMHEASLGEDETIGPQEWHATTSRALSRSVELKVLAAKGGHEPDDDKDKDKAKDKDKDKEKEKHDHDDDGE